MKKISLSFILALTLTSCSSNPKDKLDSEFSFQGRPIEPWCINSITHSSSPSVNLAQCSNPFSEINITSPVTPELQKQGFMGYSYEYKNDTPVMSPPYIFYKYLGKTGELHAVHKMWSDGRSGKHSYVYLIERKGDTLNFINGYGGDRCMGGVIDAKVEAGKVKYTKQLTPLTFIQNSSKNVFDYNTSSSLSDCATCCYMTGEFSDNEMISVKFNPSLNQLFSDNKAGHMQYCFDKLFKSYVKRNKLTLNSIELNQFIDSFEKKCVKYKR